MRHKALLLTLLLLSSLGFAQTKSAEKPAAKPARSAAASSAAAPDKALMQQVLDAWGTLDIPKVAKFYDQSPNDVFYDVLPLKYQGFAEYGAGVQKNFADVASAKLTANEDAAVHHAGNWAWSTSTVKFSMTDKAGKTTNLECRWTAIWQKKGASWVIVHDHFSTPLPPEPAK
ncbi:MAG: YybH family protein [Terriglobales bacterium]